MIDFAATPVLMIVLAAAIGASIGVLAACVPGLHVYNLMGGVFLGAGFLSGSAAPVPVAYMMPASVAMVTAWSIVNAVPAILLSAPDESAMFTVLPGQRYLMAGRGHEAITLTAAGGAGGIAMVLASAAIAPRVLPIVHAVLSPHFHWIVWSIVVFMLMSEWPKRSTGGLSTWGRLRTGWSGTGAGLATFLLSGLLGFVLLYRSPLPVATSAQNLMPAFAGLFAAPWLIFNLVIRVDIPPQLEPAAFRPGAAPLLKGIGTGALGGAFAAFVPVVSGGIGGMLAGHAASTRDERTFLVAQGAAKSVYYSGGLLLLFVPGLHLARGGAAAMLKGFCVPDGADDYGAALAAAALATAVALLLLPACTRTLLGLTSRFGYRTLSAASLAGIMILVLTLTGAAGLLILAVATGIGFLPVLFDSRRMNCLGIILLPVACNMSGIGPRVAHMLGLL